MEYGSGVNIPTPMALLKLRKSPAKLAVHSHNLFDLWVAAGAAQMRENTGNESELDFHTGGLQCAQGIPHFSFRYSQRLAYLRGRGRADDVEMTVPSGGATFRAS